MQWFCTSVGEGTHQHSPFRLHSALPGTHRRRVLHVREVVVNWRAQHHIEARERKRLQRVRGETYRVADAR